MRITIEIPEELMALLRSFVSRGPSRQPGDDEDEPPPPARPQRPHRADDSPGLEPQQAARRPESGDGNNRGGGQRQQDGPPRNGRQFAGWVYKQPKSVSDRAKDLAGQEGMGTRWTDLSDGDAQWLYRELTGQVEPSRNGHGGGH